MDQEKIRSIVAQVIENIKKQGLIDDSDLQKSSLSSTVKGQSGVFPNVESAIRSAKYAQKELVAMGMEKRKEIIIAIREAGIKNARMLAEMTVQETGMGRVEDKVQKNEGAAGLTPGIEDLTSEVKTGNRGMLLVEWTPYGLINAITPSTNPTSTVIHNSICMISAGNSVIFSPHPLAKECTLRAMTLINDAIVKIGGPENLLVSVADPTLRTAKEIMDHTDVDMIVATGGAGVVRVALSSGKKALAAGPGNPPVIVDETADISKSAIHITNGASFDNNLLCIGEKEVFVVQEVADKLIDEMVKNGCYLAKGREATAVADLVTEDGKPNKDYIGKDASYILEKAGIKASSNTRVVILETDADHPLVMQEYLMPVLPIVKVRNFEEALEYALKAEQGFRHTSIIHSKNIDRITKFVQTMRTTVMVVNGCSLASMGFEAEGIITLTIAGTTGEGYTTPKNFAQQSRITMVDSVSVFSTGK
ncbi:TPA: aldehyde dehydrogenase EutE [Candidatus Poribacteria bacterium]|nr:aldehyde dehydrogenase EutE [Candidatus Poribacteria bacterium]